MTHQTMTQWLTPQFAEPLDDLLWPQELGFSGEKQGYAIFDPRNALVTVVGAGGLALADLELDDVCSRLVVVDAENSDQPWLAAGLTCEGEICGYWPGNTNAKLWSKMTRNRSSAKSESTLAPAANETKAIQFAEVCRVVEGDDASAIHSLMAEAFPDYQLPADPGAIRYALASGAVHGRGVFADDGTLLAYASVEFQRAGGSVEITDCATARAQRGQGLMTNIIESLVLDVAEVFEGRFCHCFARQDQLGMQKVLANLGWQRRGRLVNHFKVGEDWLSAWVWGL